MAYVKKAYDIARKQVFYCNSSDPLSEVAGRMHNNNIGSILVKENDHVRGIITVNDILRKISRRDDVRILKAKDVMSSPVITIDKDIEIDKLVEMFKKHKVSRMVLVDSKKNIVGVVRDIAVYKCMTFFKFDNEARNMFLRDYNNKLY